MSKSIYCILISKLYIPSKAANRPYLFYNKGLVYNNDKRHDFALRTLVQKVKTSKVCIISIVPITVGVLNPISYIGYIIYTPIW